MRKAIFPLLSLLLLGASQLASAFPVTLLTDNTRSSSGALSFQPFKTCEPAVANGCYNPNNSWYIANGIQGSDATWDWNPTTGVLTATGLFWSTSFLSSNPNASSVISDRTTNLTINTMLQTTTATTYNCIEGNFLAGVGANGCLNVSTGSDFVTNSSALYNVGGAANCVQRTLAGDDVSTGNPRGLFTDGAVGACDPVDGGYSLYTVTDNTATGGTLLIGNDVPIGTCITFGCPAEPASAGAHWLTFAVAQGAEDDGPIDVQQAVTATIDVLANDSGFTDPVTVTITTAPSNGTAIVTGSPGSQAVIRVEYTSNSGATGTDTFVYTLLDGNGTTSDTATVTVNILAFGANPDTGTTTRNSSAININVGANDAGFADPVTLTITGAPSAGGTATPPAGPVTLANAIISYTPATTAAGAATYTETFTYEITDDDGLTDTAVVTVTVNNTVPDAVAGPLSAISTQGFAPAGRTGTFTAPGTGGNLGNAPSVVSVSAQGTKGNATVAGNVITYTITDAAFFTGTDTFTYTITDADEETDSAEVTVTIANALPLVANRSFTTTEGTPSAAQTLGITLGNGSQAQHDLTVSTQATNGTCALNGTSLTYTPNAAYTGADSCVVTITDEGGAGQSGTGTMTITVNAAGGGGGGGGASLPAGSSSFDLWSLSLLAGISWLRRRRLLKPVFTGDHDHR